MSKLKAGGGQKAPWMPFYGRDFYSDVHVLAMTWEQRGLYQFLLWTAWDEGAIPGAPKMLARVCGVPLGRFAKSWAVLEPRWIPHPTRSGWLINRRQEEVRAQSGELSQKMRALADLRWAREAAGRIASGQNEPTDHAFDPHADPQCETACDAASGSAMLTTSHTPEVRDSMDGRMDGVVPLSEPEGRGVRTPGPGLAGDIAAQVVRELRA